MTSVLVRAEPLPVVVRAISAARASLTGRFITGVSADGSEYIEIPEGSGTNLDSQDRSSSATFHLYCGEEADLTFGGVVWAADGSSNSVHLAMDCGAARTWDLGEADTGYGPGWVTDAGGTQTTFARVSAGHHTVTVVHREDGVRLRALGMLGSAACSWREGTHSCYAAHLPCTCCESKGGTGEVMRQGVAVCVVCTICEGFKVLRVVPVRGMQRGVVAAMHIGGEGRGSAMRTYGRFLVL